MAEKDSQERKENEEMDRINADFCSCPYCACCFFTKADLEKHIATFGNSKEEHYENHRRVHARLEHGSGTGPE